LLEAARGRWKRHRKFHVSFEEVWSGEGPAPELCSATAVELSAGRWRALLCHRAGFCPPVQPQHERRKYLIGSVPPLLLKFAGLAPFGGAKLRRAEILADAGYGPHPAAFSNGFLAMPFLPGAFARTRSVTAEFLRCMAGYAAARRRLLPSPEGISVEPLLAMVRTNITEAVPRQATGALDRLDAWNAALSDRQAVQIDGRMLPHEWLLTAQGYVKVDALDHCEDHFLPGCADIAWDLAGASIEFALQTPQQEALLEAYEQASGDRGARPRLSFYLLAYAAFRLGYCELAAQQLRGTVDGAGFALLAKYYQRRARSALRRAAKEVNYSPAAFSVGSGARGTRTVRTGSLTAERAGARKMRAAEGRRPGSNPSSAAA
jgi:hypothetical protein